MISVTSKLVENDTVFPAQSTCVRSLNEKRRRKRVIGGTPSHLGKTPVNILILHYIGLQCFFYNHIK